MKRTYLAVAAVVALAATGCTSDKSEPDPAPGKKPAAAVHPKFPEYDNPAPGDFELQLVTKSKQCYGEVGCILTVEPELAYVERLNLNPKKAYDLRYKVKGSDDGEVIETIKVDDKGYSFDEVVVSTKGDDVDPEPKILDVTEAASWSVL